MFLFLAPSHEFAKERRNVRRKITRPRIRIGILINLQRTNIDRSSRVTRQPPLVREVQLESLACQGSLDKWYLLAQKIKSPARSPMRLDIQIEVEIRSSHEWLLYLVVQTQSRSNLFLLSSICRSKARRCLCLLTLVRNILHLLAT